jgi:hypothetical protein
MRKSGEAHSTDSAQKLDRRPEAKLANSLYSEQEISRFTPKSVLAR